jgi:hypothetical protein
MLRVLAREALAVATLHGAALLSFRGYRIAARRLCACETNVALVEIKLAGCCGGDPLDRVRIAVASRSDAGSAWRIDSLHTPTTAVCTTESLAGCVSPVDARYASPETGQIS